MMPYGNLTLFLGASACAVQTQVRGPAAEATDNLPDLVSRVTSAVVNIRTTQLMPKASLSLRSYVLGSATAAGEVRASALGSGFIVSVQGGEAGETYLLTNNHVVAEADEIEIMLSKGSQSYPAKL